VTRPVEDVEAVFALAAEGLSRAEIARRTGISRAAIRQWLDDGPEVALARRGRHGGGGRCDAEGCALRRTVPQEAYAYLLGLYLGDGCISEHRRHVFRLRIICTAHYQQIIDQCVATMSMVLPNVVHVQERQGCVEVSSYSKPWPCLFPQHGKGPKHARPIVLDPWQQEVIRRHREMLLRGLIHSDGCRDRNFVNGREYPRYQFSNRSDDVRRSFTETCDALGVRWRQSNRWTVSVARRADVAALDVIIGPKS
jgi:hypothetical protein